MIRMFVVAVTVTGLFIAGCGQEQPAAPAQPKAEAKPAAEPAAPAPPSPPTPAPATPIAETAKTIATPTETPKPPEPPATAAKSVAPAAPLEQTKAVVKIPEVPDSLILPASQGAVTFHHLVHAKLFPCASCHGDGTPGKLALDKDTAHALCRDCHKARNKGPTACGECHKK